MKYTNLGHMNYEEVFELQKTLLTLRQEKKIDDLLLIVEHEPVITKGLRATDENILKSKEELSKMTVKVLDIRRGGDVTYHGPGQVVGYPIVDLRNYGKGVRLLRNLSEVNKILKESRRISSSTLVVYINVIWKSWSMKL